MPQRPQRIVALDSLMALPALLEVGAPVVGAVSVYQVGDPFPDYLEPADVEGIEVVGSLQGPNLEAVAAARPDLIIGAVPVVQPVYEQLQAIAPTVVTRYSFYSSTWLDDVRLVAGAAGLGAEIERSIDELEARQAEVAAALATRGSSHTLSRIDMYQGSPLYYRFGCVWFGTVLGAAGVTQPAAQGPDDCTDGDYKSVLVYPSAEQLDVLDADAIVAYQQQAGQADVGADPLAALSANPLWTKLPAVQAGRVHVFGDAWGLGVSIQAADVILDDVEDVVFPG